MLKRITSRLLNILWTCFAVATVVMAVLVTAVRFAIPHLDRYRGDFETWLSDYMGNAVVISEMSGHWQGWTPTFTFKRIELRDHRTGRTITRFQDASIELDPLRTLRAREPVPGKLTVSGIQLNVIKDEQGKVTIEGVAPSDPGASGQRNALVDWLLNQKDLEIRSAQVVWLDRRSERTPTVFPNTTLRIRSEGQHYQISGEVQLPPELGTHVRFALDAGGDLLSATWQGQLYLQGSAIELATFMDAFDLDYPRRALRGNMNFELWSHWDQARVRSLEGTFSLGELATAQQTLVTRVEGKVAAQRADDSPWRVSARDILISGAEDTARVRGADLDFASSPDGHTVYGVITSLPLSDLLPHLSSVIGTQDGPLRFLRGRGELYDLAFKYRPDADPQQRYRIQSRFRELALAGQAYVPAVSGLSGYLDASPQGGRLQLDSKRLELEMKSTLAEPVELDAAGGRLVWERLPQGWRFRGDALTVRNRDGRIDLEGALFYGDDRQISADLVLNLRDGQLRDIRRYLPLTLKPKLRDWLERAIVDGTVSWAGVALRGKLAEFPFDDHQGKFEVRAQVTDGILDYAKRWPRAEDIEAEILVSGRRLSVHAPSGTVREARVSEVSGGISDLFTPGHVVKVSGHASGDTAVAGTSLPTAR